MADAVTDRTRMIIVCTPNNPTGPIVTQAAFDAFLARVPRDVLIVLDEAYAEFVTDSDAVDGARVLAARHPHVVVLRTFSKAYGLAGLRVGYAVGDPRVLAAARSTGIPLSVTAAAEEAALASLDAEDELRARVAELAERRDALAARLRDVGWDVPVAQGNFVWLPPETGRSRSPRPSTPRASSCGRSRATACASRSAKPSRSSPSSPSPPPSRRKRSSARRTGGWGLWRMDGGSRHPLWSACRPSHTGGSSVET